MGRTMSMLARSISGKSTVRRLKLLLIGVVTLSGLACPCDDPIGPNTPALGLLISPDSLRVSQGATATFEATIARFNLNGPVTLAVSGRPGWSTVSLSPQVIPAGATKATISVQVAADAPYSFNSDGSPKSESITLTATGPGGERDVQRLLMAVTPSAQAGVTLSMAPSALTVRAGESGQGIVTVSRQGGYTGRTVLALTEVEEGLTVTLTPNGTTPDSYVVRVSVSATDAPSFGRGSFNIVATPEGLAPVTLPFVVTIPDIRYGPEVARPSVTSAAGGRDTVTVRLHRSFGFTGGVTLSLVNPPAGISGTFSPNPATDDISLLTVQSTLGVAPGSYPLTILAVPPAGSGLEQKTVSLTYVVTAPPVTGSYTLAAANLSVVAGTPASTNLTVARGGGFTAPVNVAITTTGGQATPAGLTIAVENNPVSGSTALRVTTSAGTPPGVYAFTVTGSTPGLADVTTTFTVTVTAPRRATSILTFKRVNGVPQGTSAESVAQGSTVALEATVLDQNGAPMVGAPVIWTSASTNVAVVSSTGVVTGVSTGTTNVIVRSTDNPAVEATVAITVTAPPSAVARIEIEPRDARITAPATLQYRVNYFNAAGARITTPEAGGSLQFVSSSNAIASIDATSGLATGMTGGVTTITARYLRNGTFVVSDATSLTVAAPGTAGNYGSVAISSQGNTRDLRLAHGYTVQLIVRTPSGAQVTSGVSPAPTLTSSNPNVTVAPSQPPPGAPEGYYFSVTVGPNATAGSAVTLRADVTGASSTINFTIVP